MKQSDKEVGKIVDKVLCVSVASITRELFNRHVIDSASESNSEVVMSSDGYAMIEINGEAEIIIPTILMGLEDIEIPYKGVIVKTESPLDKLMKELNSEDFIRNNIEYIEKEISSDYQPWKKSHQYHPAFKRKK